MIPHEHKYIAGTIGDECSFCGLLKSTIESTEKEKCCMGGCGNVNCEHCGIPPQSEKPISEMTLKERQNGYYKEYRELLDENMRITRGKTAKMNHKKALRKKWGFPLKGGIEEMSTQGASSSEKSWEEAFDEKFVDKINNINGGFAYEELKYGEQQDVEELRQFIRAKLKKARQSLLTSLLNEAPKDKDSKSPTCDGDAFCDCDFSTTSGFNTCNQEWRKLIESKLTRYESR